LKTKKTMEIRIETDRVLTIRRRRGVLQAWCQECGEQRDMICPEEAAGRAGVSLRAIYRRVEAKSLHFIETPDGLVFICLDSLTRLK
jgi:hypothetical protein